MTPLEALNRRMHTLWKVNILTEDEYATYKALLEAAEVLKAMTGMYRTFRGVPFEEQHWTSIDDDTLAAGFDMLERLEKLQ